MSHKTVKVELFMSRSILAIDIRENGIAAVQVKKTMKESWIENCLYIPVTESVTEPGDWIDRVRKGLEQLAEKIDVQACRCIASFPAVRVSFRNMQVPFKEPKKIRQILPFELEPHLALPMDEQLMDFIPIHTTGEQTDLIAAVLQKSEFKSFLDAFTENKIDPETITIGGYPVALSLINNPDSPETWLLADVDSHQATLFLIVSGRISLIRSFSLGPDLFNGPNSLCDNILRTVSAFEDACGTDLVVETVFITGSGLPETAVEQELAPVLELPVTRLNLLDMAGMAVPDQSDHIWKSDVMDNALALALTEVNAIDCLNFRKDTFSVRKQWTENRKLIITTGLIAVMAVCLGLFSIAVDTWQLKQQVNAVDERLADKFRASFPEVTRIVDPVHQMHAHIKEMEKTSLFSVQTGSTQPVIDIIYEISSLIPRQIDVDLDRMVIDEESVMISGQTDTFNSIDDVKNRLEQSDMFKTVTISSANMDRTDNRVRFKLKVIL